MKFIKTNDDSTGLYDEEIKDIFHSKTGAKKESEEKFIIPLIDFIKETTEITNKLNILDICFGIGYNTKSLLNQFPNITYEIDALEFNEEYTIIAPLIKDMINNHELRYFLLEQQTITLNKYIEIQKEYINQNEAFFDDFYSYLNKEINVTGYLDYPNSSKNLFLHNIYYNYISNSMLYNLNVNKYKNSSIKYHIGDARQTLKSTNNNYDIVFLDAFSSQKDPTLWTVDFLNLIKSKMKDNSILVSYSKASPFRKSLLDLGFYVGKTFIDNIDMGTVATSNEKFIQNPLSEYDYQLLNTRCGISYKDPDFLLSGKDILKQREIEQKNSNLISHTQFLKKYRQ